MGFILKERLRKLKGVIKGWSSNVFDVGDVKKRQLIKRVVELDLKSELGGLVDEEVVERKLKFDELLKILKSLDIVTYQRSRIKWLKEGDSNSRFFHNCIKARKRRNSVFVLNTSEGRVEGPVNIRREVVSYFTNHFENEEWRRPTLDGILFPHLEVDKVNDLTRAFSLDEITDAVRGCDASKSPGPDGFNFAFIKEF
jgi:hypothetical protein